MALLCEGSGQYLRSENGLRAASFPDDPTRSMIREYESLSPSLFTKSSTTSSALLLPPPSSLPLCSPTPCTGVLTFFGMNPKCQHLPECAGHCEGDSDCADDLICFRRTSDTIYDSVPGCETMPYGKVNYCVAREFKPMHKHTEPTMEPAPELSSVRSYRGMSSNSPGYTTSETPVDPYLSSNRRSLQLTSGARSTSFVKGVSNSRRLSMVCLFCFYYPFSFVI